MNLNQQPQYIYLLQEREFIKTNENIYKVGMTKQENLKRLKQYPKDSVLLFQMICINCNDMEKKVITLFKQHFKVEKCIGNEYFRGDYKIMIDFIYSCIKSEQEENIKVIKEQEHILKVIKEDFEKKCIKRKYDDTNSNCKTS
jgi:hypothetical protein